MSWGVGGAKQCEKPQCLNINSRNLFLFNITQNVSHQWSPMTKSEISMLTFVNCNTFLFVEKYLLFVIDKNKVLLLQIA